MKRKHAIDPVLINMLEESGLPHEIAQGRRHLHVKVDGRLVTVLPISGNHDCRCKTANARASVRRAIQERKSA